MTVLHPAGLCWLVLAVLLGYIFSSLFRLNVSFSGVALTTFMTARSGNESRSGVGWGGEELVTLEEDSCENAFSGDI